MATGIQETTDVPADQVENVVAGYQLDNPINIERIRQPNGLWTIKATFPDDDDSA